MQKRKSKKETPEPTGGLMILKTISVNNFIVLQIKINEKSI